jgi:hypothetical protein
MTTPERVAELLQEDAALTDNERQALAELFAAAYEQLTADGRPLTAFLFDNDDTSELDLETPTRPAS